MSMPLRFDCVSGSACADEFRIRGAIDVALDGSSLRVPKLWRAVGSSVGCAILGVGFVGIIASVNTSAAARPIPPQARAPKRFATTEDGESAAHRASAIA